MILCLCLSAKSFAADPKGLTMHRVQAGIANENGWYEAKSTQGSFKVFLPIPFNDFTSSWQDENKDYLKAYIIGSKSIEGFKFSVTEMRKNILNQEKTIQEFVAGFKSDQKNKILKQEYLEYSGYPGAELKITNNTMSAVERIIVPVDRIFLLVVEYPTEKEKQVEALIPLFFNSLIMENR